MQAGDFIALSGELGSGKTRFVRGVAEGLTVDPATQITSPTYSLLHIYTGRLPLYHFDLYRLAGDADVAELGFAEFFFGDGVSLVEWADRLGCVSIVVSEHHGSPDGYLPSPLPIVAAMAARTT